MRPKQNARSKTQNDSPKTRRAKRKPTQRPQISVRMYRGLLGNCFLLRFPHAGDKYASVLIDCGVFRGMEVDGKGEKQLMEAVAADIKETVGEIIDVVVVTHEH